LRDDLGHRGTEATTTRLKHEEHDEHEGLRRDERIEPQRAQRDDGMTTTTFSTKARRARRTTKEEGVLLNREGAKGFGERLGVVMDGCGLMRMVLVLV
jgi:hypothetical protein